ncbi:glycosyltransferase family 87 protein [Trinickia sp.]|uniref:glycosyltransferase family 87 protein n=1 Tax=Trinickia sp. TaxID=2571163 RepID=UPI003F811498
MDHLSRGKRGASRCVHGWLTPSRLLLYSSTLIVIYAIVMGVWAWTTDGFSRSDISPPGIDFAVFWVASHVVLHGSPWQVYSHLVFAKAEAMLLPSFQSGNFLPWLYPPAFLFVVAPFALLPLAVSYLLFVGISVLLFTRATLRVSGLGQAIGQPRLAALFVAVAPSVFVAAAAGQNSLLTATFAGLAVHWVNRKPVLAGFCIGLLAIKPQMAIVFPFVLIAAGAWRTFVVAAVTALSITALGVLAGGTETVHLFLLNAEFVRSVIIQHAFHFWRASPTTLAALRINGVGLTLAECAQAWVAFAAIAAACQVWRRTGDTRLRCSVLAISTLIANPYVWHYELTWLGIAMACLLSLGFKEGWLRGEQEILALAWLLPLYEYFNPYLDLPQLGPIVLLAALLVIPRRMRATAEGTFSRADNVIAAKRVCVTAPTVSMQRESVNNGG